jgi:hypothetical protein
MEKIETLTFQQIETIIKAYYARHGRNWDDYSYHPKIEDGMLVGFDVYKK